MRGILFIAVLLLSGISFAQPGVVPTKVVDGTTYYVHTVKSGNTLWGLQQIYGVSVDDIVKSNPGLTEGIHEGQVILIPANDIEASKEIKTKEYKVKARETLYGISRKFNTTVDDLIKLNPELSNGLQRGQMIKVPAGEEDVEEPVDEITTDNPFVTESDTVLIEDQNGTVQVTFSDTTIRHTVLAHETMYSISNRFMVSIDEIMKLNGLTSTSLKEGQILIIPVKKEAFDQVEVKTVNPFIDEVIDTSLALPLKDSYNIALMLPFYIEHGPGYSEYVSDVSTQYYMGTVAAIDSLKKLGLNATLFVYDTKNDSTKVNSILRGKEFQNMDLVIGPLYGSTVGQVATYCKNNRIRMVCPLAVEKSIMRNNPFIYSSVPSDVSLFRGLADYLAANEEYQKVVLIRPRDKDGALLADVFKAEYLESSKNGSSPTLIDADPSNFTAYVQKGVKVAFIYPTDNKTSAVKFMSNMNTAAILLKEDEISVFGTKEWVNIEEMNNVYKNKYRFHYPGPNYLDYYSSNVSSLNESFRNKFNTDLSRVAIQSYDIMMYFASSFFMRTENAQLLMNKFDLKQVAPGDGFENKTTFIIGQKDFELFKIDTIAR